MKDPFADDFDRPPTSPPIHAAAPPPQTASGHHPHMGEEPNLDLVGGLNPLLAAAHPLLTIIAQLRSGRDRPSRDTLRAGLLAAFAEFEARARRSAVSERNVITARYILATAIDEAAAMVVQEGPTAWYQKGLLPEMRLDNQGGEKIFRLASTLAKNPAAERELLQFIWVVLSQGFQGVFATMDDGQTRLNALRERIHQLLQKDAPAAAQGLSPQWQVAAHRRRPMLGWLPLWVTAAITAGVLLLVYMGYIVALRSVSSPMLDEITALRQRPSEVKQAVTSPRLGKLLTAQVAERRIRIEDTHSYSTITLQGDTFFAPGSAEISESVKPVLHEVARALLQIPEPPITVSGHTDDRPVQGGRYRNNYELSKARAEAVVDLLSETIGRSRMHAVGEDQSKPLVPNSTDANRAANRRVEITLHYGTSRVPK